MKDISAKIAAKDIEGRGLSKNDFTDEYRYSLTSLIKYIEPTLVSFPLGLTWNAIKYPVGDIKLLDSVGPTRTRGYMQKSAQELFDEHSIARYNPGATFYVQPAGSDSADGYSSSSSLFPVAYMCDDIAEMWVDSAKANMPSSTNNFFANGTAIMYLNNVWPAQE